MKEYFIETGTSAETITGYIMHRFGQKREIKQARIGSGTLYLIDKIIRIKLNEGTIKFERNDGKDFSEEDQKYIEKLKSEIGKLPKCINVNLNEE